MPRALLAVADGVEDIETVTLLDVLRRAEIEVVMASVEARRMFTCARGSRLTADAMLLDVLAQDFDLLVLPGGAVGAERLASRPPPDWNSPPSAPRPRWRCNPSACSRDGG